MNATMGLLWRWLRYRWSRLIPDVIDPVAVSRRSIRGRRQRVERAIARVCQSG